MAWGRHGFCTGMEVMSETLNYFMELNFLKRDHQLRTELSIESSCFEKAFAPTILHLKINITCATTRRKGTIACSVNPESHAAS